MQFNRDNGCRNIFVLSDMEGRTSAFCSSEIPARGRALQRALPGSPASVRKFPAGILMGRCWLGDVVQCSIVAGEERE